jgi:multidrug efflux system membrane fusion protein
MRYILASGWLVVGVLACLVSGGCEQSKGPMMGGPKGPPEVEVSLPVSKEITDYEEFSGRLEAKESIQIRARVTGYLVKAPPEREKVKGSGKFFKEGGLVQKGDLLFEIDPLLYEAQLARAKAAVLKAEASFQQAERDWNRARTLHDSNIQAIGREEYDKFRGIYAVAEAECKVARADLKIAQVNMDYCRVVAPISGRVSKVAVDPGNLVKADDTMLTSIGDSNPIKAYFDVDERTLTRILHLMEQGVIPKEATGVPVEMGLADEEDRPHQGFIDFTDNFVDVGTGTLRARGSFENPRELLVPGMFVRVRLPIGQPQKARMIAEKALVTDQGQKYVYVVKDENTAVHEGKVEYRRVKLGRLNDGLRVIKDGLADNEKVVVSGLQRVRPDIQVKFKDVPMPTAAPAGAPTDPTKPNAGGNASAPVSRTQPDAPAREPQKEHRPRSKGH